MQAAAAHDERAALSCVELFAGLSDHVLDRLAQRVVVRSWARGDLIVSQGADGDSLIVLVRGAVTVYRHGAHGAKAALAHLAAPTTIGEVTLFDGASRSASVEAVEPCAGLELRRADLLALVHDDPLFLDALLRALGALVRRLSEQAADQLLLDLPGRVAKTLVGLCSSHPERPVVTLSQGRIAELAGGTRQSLNQVLRRFSERGLIRVDAGEIVLQDVPTLQRRAGLSPGPAGPGAQRP